ncbi:hypothetical protein [Ancylobacter sp. SL191]|uniref:hypothetical protein n=1 Tax=Ancylobacter sp. SL191 TaxID=2995166 RepID=UPI002270415A|nr:hypothetical protein [Ancylobacter sp. SL191]WAC25758.1 hypothetical protein OU996_12025 [Ancylobacter sp. SL191]
MSGRAGDYIRGTKAIAHELGVSRATFFRLRAQGQVPGLSKVGTGGKTSPVVMDRKSLQRLRDEKEK